MKKLLLQSLCLAGLMMTQANVQAESNRTYDKTDATLMIMLTQKYNKGCARWSKNKYPEKLEGEIDVNARRRMAHAAECIAKLSKRDPQYQAMLKKHENAKSLKGRGFIEYDLQF